VLEGTLSWKLSSPKYVLPLSRELEAITEDSLVHKEWDTLEFNMEELESVLIFEFVMLDILDSKKG
jgi:hypothetical protein